MKEGQHCYTIASSVRASSILHTMIQGIRSLLEQKNIPHSLPKFPDHVTLVRPFLATKEEAHWLLIGLTIGKSALTFGSNPDIAYTTRLDFVIEKDEDTLIISLSTNAELRSVLKQVPTYVLEAADMYRLPEELLTNFHTTIATGFKLCKHIEVAGGLDTVFKKTDVRTHTDLEYPSLYRKQNDKLELVTL